MRNAHESCGKKRKSYKNHRQPHRSLPVHVAHDREGAQRRQSPYHANNIVDEPGGRLYQNQLSRLFLDSKLKSLCTLRRDFGFDVVYSTYLIRRLLLFLCSPFCFVLYVLADILLYSDRWFVEVEGHATCIIARFSRRNSRAPFPAAHTVYWSFRLRCIVVRDILLRGPPHIRLKKAPKSE